MSPKSGRAFSVLVCSLLAAVPAFAADAPASVAPAVSGPFTAAQQASVDAALARAQSVADDLEALAEGAGDGSGCPRTATVRDISVDYKAGKFAKGTAGEVHRLIGLNPDKWELANVCLAYARKDAAICSDMIAADYDVDPADINSHPQDFTRGRCRSFARILPVYRAYDAKDPGFVDACAGLASDFNGLTSPDALRKACSALAAYNGDPEPFIAAYTAAVNPAPSRTEALENLRKLTADPTLCDQFRYASQKEVCRERVSFQRASAAKSKAACRGALCRVMMGDPASACETYAAEVKKGICRAAYLPGYVDDETRAFQGLSDQVVAALTNAGLDDRASLTAVNQRLDRLFALRARLDDAAARVAPKAPPAKTAERAK